jgi:aminopeptidase N
MRIALFLCSLAILALTACRSTEDPSMQKHNPDVPQRDPHSFSQPSAVCVQHVSLDLDLDFDQLQARGTCTLSLRRTDPSAPLWLDTEGLLIDSVMAVPMDTPVPFELGPRDPTLGQPLRIELPSACDRVRIVYRTAASGAAAMQWLSSAQTSGDQPFLFTQGQAILTRSWIPLQDSPAVRVTWDARIRAPKGLRPLMSAEERGGDAATGYTFAMRHPVPSYLIALACGKLEERIISARCAVWAEPEVVEAASKELEDMERMVAACEQLFGPYRWGRYDVLVLPASFPFGGMENPCLTFATPTILAGDKSLVALIAHELAHSWSGNLVTNATWRDFWLNEGFTVYLEQRIMEHVYGVERAKMEIALSMRQLAQELRTLPPGDQVLHIDLAGRNPDDGMTSIPYDKGAAFLRRLEQVFGRQRFDAFLRAYFDRYAFQSITTSQFSEWLQHDLLDQEPKLAATVDVPLWIETPGLPADAPFAESTAFLAVDVVREAVSSQKSAAALLALGDLDWNTQQWLRFLADLRVDAAVMAAIDTRHRLTTSGNSEVLCLWLELAIAADYAPAMPRLEQFLVTVGRRKFLKPLYEALLRTANGKERALAMYQKARPHYHAVAVRTLDELLGYAAPTGSGTQR